MDPNDYDAIIRGRRDAPALDKQRARWRGWIKRAGRRNAPRET